MTGRTRRQRVALGAVVAGAALLVTTIEAAPAQADQTYYVPISKSWTVSGRGYGHGHGMSQYGAQGAALKGLDYTKIAKFYYPKTSWGRAKGKVRVLISADTTSDVQVAARSGLTVRDLRDNSVWTLPTGHGKTRWQLTPAAHGSTAVRYLNSTGWHRWRIPGSRRTLKGDGQFHAPGPLTLYVPSGSGLAQRTYRGSLRSARPSSGSSVRDTVNVVTMDQYVQGVVPYEMPASWRQQALRTQAVAARTYAAWQRSQSRSRYYQICDTTACQVYGGVGAEEASSNNAVQGTGRRILTYRHEPAFTQFSASSGGWTSAGGQPYLPAQKDPYDNFPGNGVHSWRTKVSTAALEKAHPSIGRLVKLRVTRRDGHGAWGGRVEQIVLDGTKGTAHLSGDDFRWQYALRSSWFNISPTPISKRWRSLGGRKSSVGAPTTGEYAVKGGAAQRFKKGRNYWSSHTGARELTGRIVGAYKKWGGPTSNLGLPETGMMRATRGGHKAVFRGGRIYSSDGTGANVVYGKVLKRWGRSGATSGWLGYPTTDVHKVDGGRRARFQHGVLTWDRSSGRVRVRRT